VLIPLAWKRQVRRHPELFDGRRVTHASRGIPGNPVNVALLGPEFGRTSYTKSAGFGRSGTVAPIKAYALSS